jgi:hypothetical protein
MKKTREYAGKCCQTASPIVQKVFQQMCWHMISNSVPSQRVTQASDNDDTSVLQPHSQGQLGMPPNMLADSFTTASLIQT